MSFRSNFLLGILILSLMPGCGLITGKALKTVPDFQLPTYKNPDKQVRLSDWTQEGAVLLTFWASWCPTCASEVPHFNQIQQDFAPEEVKVLAVNVEESVEKIQAFDEQYPMHYEVLMDSDGAVAEKLGITGLPVVILLANKGKIVYYGFSPPKDITRYLP